jgi:hypothetical protein
MASPACQANDGNSAIFVGTFLETGESFTLCRDDLESWALALAQNLTGVPVIQFANEYSMPEVVDPTLSNIDDLEQEYADWLEANRMAIDAVMAEGASLEEAIAMVREVEVELDAKTTDSPIVAN